MLSAIISARALARSFLPLRRHFLTALSQSSPILWLPSLQYRNHKNPFHKHSTLPPSTTNHKTNKNT